MAKARPAKQRQKSKSVQPPLPGIPPPEPPGTTRVLPMQLHIGDLISDESGTWQVIARPYSSAGEAHTSARAAGRSARGDGDAAVGIVREGHGHTESHHRGGQAMMRLRMDELHQWRVYSAAPG